MEKEKVIRDEKGKETKKPGSEWDISVVNFTETDKRGYAERKMEVLGFSPQ